MKIRCNHLHKLMEITDRSAARYMIEKNHFSPYSGCCCADDDLNIKHHSAQTTSMISEIEKHNVEKYL